MTKLLAFGLVQSIVLTTVERVKPETNLAGGANLLAELLFEKFPPLKKIVFPNSGESNHLEKVLNDGDFTIEYPEKENGFDIKISGCGHSFAFHFIRESEDNYIYSGIDMR